MSDVKRTPRYAVATARIQEEAFRVIGLNGPAERFSFLANALEEAYAELANLRDQHEALQSLRPMWSMGYTSDSIAAQACASAMGQLWEILGVSDQTAACAELLRLKQLASGCENCNAAFPQDKGAPNG